MFVFVAKIHDSRKKEREEKKKRSCEAQESLYGCCDTIVVNAQNCHPIYIIKFMGIVELYRLVSVSVLRRKCALIFLL